MRSMREPEGDCGFGIQKRSPQQVPDGDRESEPAEDAGKKKQDKNVFPREKRFPHDVCRTSEMMNKKQPN